MINQTNIIDHLGKTTEEVPLKNTKIDETTIKFFTDIREALKAFDEKHPNSIKFNLGEPENDDDVYYNWGSDADEDPDPMETDEEYGECTIPGE